MNTPRQITDANGNAVWSWGQDEPFGDTIANQDPNGTGNQFFFNLRFPGQYYDVETGLHQNQFRDYDPATGRYIESDPIDSVLNGNAPTKSLSSVLAAAAEASKAELAGNMAKFVNSYSYTGGNPLSRFDRLGLDYGTQSCSYYSQRCKEDGGAYYCTIGPLVCGNTPDSGWTRCVRQCLQATDDKYCRKPKPKNSCSPSDSSSGDGADLPCVVNIHQMCWEECAQNSSSPPPSAQ